MTARGSIKAIAAATGISWLSVVISLLMLAFILYIFAAGSASVYYQVLFSAAPVNPNSFGTSGYGSAINQYTGQRNASNASTAAPDMSDSSVIGAGETVTDSGVVY